LQKEDAKKKVYEFLFENSSIERFLLYSRMIQKVKYITTIFKARKFSLKKFPLIPPGECRDLYPSHKIIRIGENFLTAKKLEQE
jgi:hypothetical protein